MTLFLGILLSYLVGSIPTGFLVGKWLKGIDIRRHGSGNVGATNVFRVVGKKWGIGVLIFDVLKGSIASVYLPRQIPTGIDPFLTALIFGIASIVGHTWTVWLGFRGGKGVATSAGVFIGLAPKAACVALLIWFGLFAWKRFVSLASLITALSFPILVFSFYRNEDFFKVLSPISVGLTVFIFYTHRENIQRLCNGTEKKLI